MIISGTNLGKKFGSHWVFKDLDIKISSGDRLAITGANGSGKSTLLQVLLSSLTPSRGMLVYSIEGKTIDPWNAIERTNFCAPYVEIVEELTLKEHLDFHSEFSEALMPQEEMIARMKLDHASGKSISQFSSGMKQRLKLGLTFFYDSDVIALDEPTVNLDDQGKKWYLEEIQNSLGSRTLVIASNERFEYDFCEKELNLS